MTWPIVRLTRELVLLIQPLGFRFQFALLSTPPELLKWVLVLRQPPGRLNQPLVVLTRPLMLWTQPLLIYDQFFF